MLSATPRVGDLVERAAQLGQPALTLTDWIEKPIDYTFNRSRALVRANSPTAWRG